MREALLTMLRMQHRMNTRIHADWISSGFAWHRAIWVECAELVEHHGYKWWKRQTPDLGQVQLEVVDIWHFGMSALFTPELQLDDIAASLLEELDRAAMESPLPLLDAAERLAAVAAGERRFCARSFYHLLVAAGLDMDSLYRQYLGKNVLNFFRQDHGYLDGSYSKQWGGREDNAHLLEVLPGIDTAAADAEQQLYAALAERYAGAS
jgi:dimeric dUTPase (all-alpha-NTP-PPase superfamily)